VSVRGIRRLDVYCGDVGFGGNGFNQGDYQKQAQENRRAKRAQSDVDGFAIKVICCQ
jgi:hypothetical protein